MIPGNRRNLFTIVRDRNWSNFDPLTLGAIGGVFNVLSPALGSIGQRGRTQEAEANARSEQYRALQQAAQAGATQRKDNTLMYVVAAVIGVVVIGAIALFITRKK